MLAAVPFEFGSGLAFDKHGHVVVHEADKEAFFVARWIERSAPHVLDDDVFFKRRQGGQLAGVAVGNARMHVGVALSELGVAPVVVEKIVEESSTSASFGVPTAFFGDGVAHVADAQAVLQASRSIMMHNFVEFFQLRHFEEMAHVAHIFRIVKPRFIF